MTSSLFGSAARRAVSSLKAVYRRAFPPAKGEWRDLEKFDESWKGRIAQMAAHIPAGATVLDLGCGRQWLREYLTGTYIPVDYQSRGPGTIVCDFNKREFPQQQADICFVSGCLEYVESPEWFIGEIASHARGCVISYCTKDVFPDLAFRDPLGWKNNLSRDELVAMFAGKGLELKAEEVHVSKTTIFSFSAAAAGT